MGFRIGVDVGGTFTDFLLLDSEGNVDVYKSPSTPQDPSVGFLAGLEGMASARDLELAAFVQQINIIVHGTTVATNAVLTESGKPAGLLTTRGFRDALQMRRGLREAQYDNQFTAPKPLVPRSLRLTAKERMDYLGDVREPLNTADVLTAAATFREAGLEAVAVCFMHSHANARHEQEAAELLRRELPDVYLSVSAQLLPQIRFYDRVSTTVLNAYVGPLVQCYLESLTSRLAELGFGGVLLIMKSNGGVSSPQAAMRLAASTILSGPAAGPVAGLTFVEPHHHDECITVDMGGTSFDASLTVNRQPLTITAGRIKGHSIALPMLDIHTIGAGGGSVGWIDPGGFLRMGPQSAGADPGPACYGRRGELPTCTDADLVLGYLNSDYFLGGRLPLYPELSRQAIQKHIADPLGLSVEKAASGMFEVINSNMANGIREVSVLRGYDPRDFPLVVAGGAGPIHAAVIAQELEIPFLIVPRASSIFCAAGMLLSDLKHDYVRAYPVPLADLDAERLNKLCQSILEEAHQTLRAEHVPTERQRFLFLLDLRYVGQHAEVGVPLNDGEIQDLDPAEVIARFHARHDQLYGYAVPETPVELVNVRMTAVGKMDKPRMPSAKGRAMDSKKAQKASRPVYLPDRSGYDEVSVYDGEMLQFASRVAGPAIIEQVTTTIFIPPDCEMMCDSIGSYVIFRKERAEEFSSRLLEDAVSLP